MTRLTGLCCRSAGRRFGRGEQDAGRLGAGLGADRSCGAAAGCAERAGGADRRRRVRQPQHVRWADPTPRTTTGWRPQGLRYNRFHVTAMCSPTRAALLTGRNHHAVGMGGIPEFSGAFPGLLGDVAEGCGAVPEDPEGERLLDGGDRQVAPDPGEASRARPARSPTGPTPGGSTTTGVSWPPRPASTTP